MALSESPDDNEQIPLDADQPRAPTQNPIYRDSIDQSPLSWDRQLVESRLDMTIGNALRELGQAMSSEKWSTNIVAFFDGDDFAPPATESPKKDLNQQKPEQADEEKLKLAETELKNLRKVEDIKPIIGDLRTFIKARSGEEKVEQQKREQALDQLIENSVPDFSLRMTVYRFLWVNQMEALLQGSGKSPKDDMKEFLAQFKEKTKDANPVVAKIALLQIAEDHPALLVESPEVLRSVPAGKSIYKEAANVFLKGESALGDAILKQYGWFKEEKFADQLLLAAAQKSNAYLVTEVYKEHLRNTPLGKTLLLDLAQRDPDKVVAAHASYLQDQEIGKAVLNAVVDTHPHWVSSLYAAYRDHPVYGTLVTEAHRAAVIADSTKEKMTFAKREAALAEGMATINPQFVSSGNTALDAFNQETGLSLRFGGIHSDLRQNFGIVLFNTFEGRDPTPVRLEFTFGELRKADTNEKALQLLREKYDKEKQQHAEDRKLWETPYKYDIPKDGRTAVMMATVPVDLRGTEAEMVRMLDLYKSRYGASVSCICAERKEKWAEAAKAISSTVENTQALAADKETILKELKKSLQKAVDDKKESFIFHYMMHGGKEGTMTSANGKITGEELAEVLAQPYKGKPLCEQIDITLFKSSCFSGSQREREIQYLKENKVPVKNLRIIAAAGKDTVADEGQEVPRASLVSERMRDTTSDPFNYYISYYFELMDHLQSQGTKTNPPVGTFSHALQFADRMTREDSMRQASSWDKNFPGQNPEAFHYSTEHQIEQFFTLRNSLLNGANKGS